jgi:hypothetical protein
LPPLPFPGAAGLTDAPPGPLPIDGLGAGAGFTLSPTKIRLPVFDAISLSMIRVSKSKFTISLTGSRINDLFEPLNIAERYAYEKPLAKGVFFCLRPS